MKTKKYLTIPGLTALLLAGCSSNMNTSTQSSAAASSEVSTTETKADTGRMIEHIPTPTVNEYEIEIVKVHPWNPPELTDQQSVQQVLAKGWKIVAIDLIVTNNSYQKPKAPGINSMTLTFPMNVFYYYPDKSYTKCMDRLTYESTDGEFDSLEALDEYIYPGETKKVVVTYFVPVEADKVQITLGGQNGFDVFITE